MASFLWAALGIVAGACIAIQAPINTQLGRALGMPVAAAMVSFAAGAVALGALLLLFSRIQGAVPNWSAPAPWLYFAGGCLGSVYVTGAILLTPRIGAAAVMAFSVAGQLTAGLIIDRIGFMGVAVRELSAGRIIGALLLCAGVVMIRMF
nr:EamA-like transporter family protein [Rhizobium sp. Q54]